MLRSSHGGLGPRGRPQKPVPRPPRAEGAPRKGKAPASAKREPESRRADEDFARLRKTTRTAVPAGVSSASDESREIALAVAIAAIEKKASGLEVIDVAGRVDYADFLVLMSGRSDRHVTALASAIEESLRKRNKRALAVEGLPHASWVLMDFGDVVVHVFQDDARAAYDIDGLWMDARRVPFPANPQQN
jgi:ribosome-associated protein